MALFLCLAVIDLQTVPLHTIGYLGTKLRCRFLVRCRGTIHHSDKGSQYVSLAYTERLKEAKLLASTGSTGDSYDNAMAESINGLYKAEVIHRKSWKNRKRRLSTVWQILKFLRE